MGTTQPLRGPKSLRLSQKWESRGPETVVGQGRAGQGRARQGMGSETPFPLCPPGPGWQMPIKAIGGGVRP
ncbi:hypothetical protein V6N13_096417 [Hibiscus sabdariffa]